MIITSEDGKVYVDIGSTEIWICFYSTIITKMGSIKKDIVLALEFIKNGQCEAKNCLEVAREFNLIRDKLSLFSVEELVYDMNNPSKKYRGMGI